MLDIISIIAGVFLVLRGADILTDGAVCIAQRLNMPPVVIGLTVVALGTSMPELFVSVMSAIQDVTDIAVANVVGSNIFNVLLIAGMSAAIAPMAVMRSTVTKDIPLAIVTSFVLLGCVLMGSFTRWMGVAFLALLVLYTVYSIRSASKDDAQELDAKDYGVGKATALFAFGLAMLIVGSHFFVGGATEVAASFGISDAVIGLTVVAGGTSLPELATSVVAARKGQASIAIGNVLGSCVYNILLIVGITGVISPFGVSGVTVVDYLMMTGSMVLFWLFSFTKFKLERWEGIVMVAIFVCYMAYLVSQSV